jgi:diacylglycerol kinase
MDSNDCHSFIIHPSAFIIPTMLNSDLLPERSWIRKFRDAFRGVREGVRGQNSFFVHFFMCAAVVIAGVALRVNLVEWCILILCMTGVVTAEMFNSALEAMAKAITEEIHPYLKKSLDIGSAAVLLASLGASLVGSLLFVNHLGTMLKWW